MDETLPSWSELYPDGRFIYYEGEDPEGFVRTIVEEFGFNPSEDHGWPVMPGWDPADHWCPGFHCPGEHLEAIYGGARRFPMGS